MHLSCQSLFVAVAASSSRRLPVIVLAAFLLTTWLMAQPADSRPLDRQRRAIIIDVIGSTANLSNPCGSKPETSDSGASCSSSDTSVQGYAEIAKASLVALENKLNLSLSGMSLPHAIYQLAITAEMTNQQKLREVYRSLVHHAAHIHAMKAQAINYTNEYRTVVGTIMHVQCALKCAAEVSNVEAEEFAVAAAAADVYSYASDVSQTIRDTLIAQDTIALMDTLIGLVAG